MAPFKFGKKKSKLAAANNSVNSTDSSNDIGDASRTSTFSNNNNHSNSPEQLFKKNMKSNMLKTQAQNIITNKHNNSNKNSPSQNQSSNSNGNKNYASTHNGNDINDSKSKRKLASSSPSENSINQFDLNQNNISSPQQQPPPPIPYQKYRSTSGASGNTLNSPFSLQSPSFTIVASNNNNHNNNNNNNNGFNNGNDSNISGMNENGLQDISEMSEMAQQSTGLWLTEDDLFPLKPWDRIKLPISPFPRYRHTASNVSITVNNNETSDTNSTGISSDIYVIGGLHGQSVYGDTWKLRFTRTKVNNSDLLDNFENNNLNTKNNKTFKLYCNTSSIKISEQTPPPRVGHASVMCGNAFIVFGGDTHKLTQEGLMDDDLYLFNINTKKWTIPSPIGKRPQGRYGHKISVIQQNEILARNVPASTKLFLFGGQFDETYFNDLYAFDLSSFRRDDSHWEHITPANFTPPPITNHVMCSFDNKLWIFGGETPQGLLNDVFMYDPIINDWEIIKTKANKPEDGIPQPMQEHACIVYKNLMCVYGGKDSDENYLNDLWFFNFMTKKWFKFPNHNNDILDKIRENTVSPNCLEYKPIGRSGHSLTLLQKENKLLIMGGDKFDYNINTDLNDVFAIDNDLDGSDANGSRDDEHVLGTTVYTFDLTCLKSFIPNIFDIKDVTVDSSLDLLDVAEEKQQDVEKKIVTPERNIAKKELQEEEKQEKQEEDGEENNEEEEEEQGKELPSHSINPIEKQLTPTKKEIVFDHTEDDEELETAAAEEATIASKKNIIPGEDIQPLSKIGKITVNRNSFPILSQLRDQPQVTPTDTGFAVNKTNSTKDSQSEVLSNSNPSNRDNNGGVSDFFDTYNDDESSVQLRNSMNSGHLLVNAIKNANGNNSPNFNVLDTDISRSEEEGVEYSKLSNDFGQMLDVSSIDRHTRLDNDINLNGAISGNSTATKTHADEHPLFSHDTANTGSSHTFTDENEITLSTPKVQEEEEEEQQKVVVDNGEEEKDQTKEVNLNSTNSTSVNGDKTANSDRSLQNVEESDDLSIQSHETTSSTKKDYILDEILKLKVETLRAATQTSRIIKTLEIQINELQKENNKLKDHQDYLNLQIDELNMKNMELINKSTDQEASKKQIFTALKLALSQIEKAHI